MENKQGHSLSGRGEMTWVLNQDLGLNSPDVNDLVAQLLSHVQLFEAPWTAACQASCPSQSPEVCPSSCPLHWWCHPAISSSDAVFSFCLQSFPASAKYYVVLCHGENKGSTAMWTGMGRISKVLSGEIKSLEECRQTLYKMINRQNWVTLALGIQTKVVAAV